jgi:large subunit ribosomal protein L13
VGDFVVVTNAKRLTLTGKKLDQKIYERFTGYPNGLKQYTYRRIMERRPEQIIEKAVWRMMPRGPLARQQFKKLKVYAGPDHPHAAQQPTELDLSKV